jgi:hypothetical protein
MKSQVQIELSQVGMNRPGHDASRQCFNVETLPPAPDYPAALAQLADRYGITPPRRPRGVYQDAPDGAAVQVGFIACRWNRDCSHAPARAWWEENWVTFREITLPDSLPRELRAAV